MITAIVNFPLDTGTTTEQAKALFEQSAPRYRSVDGLVRKYYLFNPDTLIAGGCYLFETRAAADAAFNDEWRALIADRYGAAPDIRFFDTPVIVDNSIGNVATAAE